MTSVERSYSTIPAGSGFYTVVATLYLNKVAFTPTELAAVGGTFTTNSHTYTVQNLGSVLNVTSPATAATGVYGLTEDLAVAADTANTIYVASNNQIAAGSILRDLGKTLYVQQNGANVQIFKYVAYVNNVTGEGAFPTASSNGENLSCGFYLPVWSADGSYTSGNNYSHMVSIARTGY